MLDQEVGRWRDGDAVVVQLVHDVAVRVEQLQLGLTHKYAVADASLSGLGGAPGSSSRNC